MKHIYLKPALSFVLIILFSFISQENEQYPSGKISNGLIDVKLYHPDNEKGFYRGSRFDWSGVISSLEYKGHQYFGLWYAKHDPLHHDAITGPVEEFIPPDFDNIKPGENFVKIGIGVMKKPDDKKYNFVTPYKLINSGRWKVKKKKSSVTYTHELKDAEYAFTYTKTLELVKGKPEMVIKHSLKNNGTKTIETDVYNHNFFVIDQQPTGPDFTITFPYNISGEGRGHGVVGSIEGNTIVYKKVLQRGENLFYPALQGFGNTSGDYDIKIENKKTGAGVSITADRPLSKLVYWSAPATVCPEPYIHIKTAPGETFSWQIVYSFYSK